MKKHAKLIGSLGIVAAMSMSIFAIASPAMAEDLIPLDKEHSRTSEDVTVRIKVVGEAPAVEIDTPLDGAVIIGKSFQVRTNYEKSSSLNYQLIHIDTDGTRTAYDLPEKVVASTGVNDGTDSFTIDITNYGGKNGDYILKVTANGAGSTTDSVQFSVVSFDFNVKGIEENTNNPIITIVKSPGVYRSLVQVFNEGGDAIFEEPIEVILNPNGNTDVTLPLARYGVSQGKYKIVATPYDEEGNIYDLAVEHFVNYKPKSAPVVPDTGSVLENLGLSRQDLISTGIALLFVCVFFGVLIIAKRNRDQKRRN
jgi:hypothetical protein